MIGDDEPSTRLPPLPDALVLRAGTEEVIAWLSAQRIPPNYRVKWLREWAAYRGVALTKAHYDRVQGFP